MLTLFALHEISRYIAKSQTGYYKKPCATRADNG
jgi:hypothetical protein